MFDRLQKDQIQKRFGLLYGFMSALATVYDHLTEFMSACRHHVPQNVLYGVADTDGATYFSCSAV